MKTIPALIGLLCLSACNSTDPGRDTNWDYDQSCPLYYPMHHEELTLRFTSGHAPAHFSISLAGQERFNSCHDLTPKEPPFVTVVNPAGADWARVSVYFGGTPDQLPTHSEIEIRDLGACDSSRTLWHADNPLVFSAEQIGPETCHINEYVARETLEFP